MAAFGIVAFHEQVDNSQYYYGGLVVFLFLSPYFETGPNWSRRRSVAGTARTLLLPFAFWYFAYLAARSVMHRPTFVHDDGPLAIALFGPALHLWFLPFLFVCLLVLDRAKRSLGEVPLFAVSSILALAGLLTAPLWREWSLTLPLPLPQWLHGISAVLLGAATGIAMRRAELRWILALVFAVVLASLLHIPTLGIQKSYVVGLTASGAAIAFGNHLPSRLSVQPVADCMLGVYLIHGMMLALVGEIFHLADIPLALAAFLLSLAVVYAARKMVPRSRLVLG